jgi:TRAP transporter TAXI family solute receptor
VSNPPEPFIQRPLELHFQGDWGWANLHRIAGWLASQVLSHGGEGTRVAVWTGGAGIDAMRAVDSGRMHMALYVPASFAPMGLDGRGYFRGESFPRLRALGTMPQDDAIVFAIPTRFGIRSFEELRAKRPALRISTSKDDGNNTLGYAVQTIMATAGIPRELLESWGGGYVEGGPPYECAALVARGAADAFFYEAIMTDSWRNLANAIDFHFLSVEEEVLKELERKLGWGRRTVPAGYHRGMERAVTTVDFSDFLVLCREDLPDDVAYLLAWAMCETREILERQYRHLPPERSSVTWPLDPLKIARTSIPLHEGARRYYEEAGYLA